MLKGWWKVEDKKVNKWLITRFSYKLIKNIKTTTAIIIKYYLYKIANFPTLR